MRNELEHLKREEPTSVLWCGDRFVFNALLARRDFPRLDDALQFVERQLPLGRRLTVWAITSDRLIPPEGVAALCEGLAA